MSFTAGLVTGFILGAFFGALVFSIVAWLLNQDPGD